MVSWVNGTPPPKRGVASERKRVGCEPRRNGTIVLHPWPFSCRAISDQPIGASGQPCSSTTGSPSFGPSSWNEISRSLVRVDRNIPLPPLRLEEATPKNWPQSAAATTILRIRDSSGGDRQPGTASQVELP